jgi:hypothetical protein
MLEPMIFAAIYGSLGIVLSVVGYFLLDLVEWRIDFAKEISQRRSLWRLLSLAFALLLVEPLAVKKVFLSARKIHLAIREAR